MLGTIYISFPSFYFRFLNLNPNFLVQNKKLDFFYYYTMKNN